MSRDGANKTNPNLSLQKDQIILITILGLGYAGYYLCRNNLSMAFPFLSETFHYTNTQLGLIAFYSELTYAIGKFITGPWIDRLGGKIPFLLGMIGAILFNLFFAISNGLI